MTSTLEELDALYRASTQGPMTVACEDVYSPEDVYVPRGHNHRNLFAETRNKHNAAWIAAMHNKWPEVVELARAGEGVPWATEDERDASRAEVERLKERHAMLWVKLARVRGALYDLDPSTWPRLSPFLEWVLDVSKTDDAPSDESIARAIEAIEAKPAEETKP